MIIALTAEYVDSFYELFAEVMNTEFTEFHKNDIYTFVNILHKKENFSRPEYQRIYDVIISIDKNNNVIGFIIAIKSVTGVSNIAWMGVDKTCRMKGVGSDLLAYYEKIADNLGYHLIELNTIKGKEDFYIKNGYYVIGVREDGHYHIDNIIMNKRVNIS
ncbi:N-acetyltransferase [Pedobacter frigiditerrae]|uniref:N-acetyltransferase n=1 Tax=Pedobacter frigiditerrae TaxID=2530452 RepID=A0A4R0N5G8_9SPHI|nr:GNAT family N-acetyltransferase [Pedobacter frigiditerrae]TCC93504.1 N-acetyltransferase [Pedobacter frigiditerrae]